jgi:hypothetical protein
VNCHPLGAQTGLFGLVAGDVSFETMLQRTFTQMVGALDHAQVPFATLVEDIKVCVDCVDGVIGQSSYSHC